MAAIGESKLAQADKHTNIGMLRARFNYYCQSIVKNFYKEHFVRFDRQIVLVDCLQPLNSGPQAFNDMRLALTQLMQSFHYGKRTLFRRLFSPTIDKLMFAATKADHITADQHANLVSLLQQLVQEAWQNAAFEGISMDCVGGLGAGDRERYRRSSGATHSGAEGQPPERRRAADGVPRRSARPPAGAGVLAEPGFHFDEFRPRAMSVDSLLPHIRLDAVMEFLLGDKLR